MAEEEEEMASRGERAFDPQLEYKLRRGVQTRGLCAHCETRREFWSEVGWASVHRDTRGCVKSAWSGSGIASRHKQHGPRL